MLSREILLGWRSLPLVCAAFLLLLPSCGGGASEIDPSVSPTAVAPNASPTADEAKENLEAIEETVEKARAIRHKYEDLFWRQPNVHGTGIGFIRDASGERTGRVGFIISVTKKVDQNELPPEDRIPDMLEGIEVQIWEEEEATIEEPTIEVPTSE